MRPEAGLRRRVVLATALVGLLAATVLVLVVQVVLTLTTRSSVDQVLEDRVALLAGAVRDGDGGLRVPDALLDPGVAVFDADGALAAGQVPRALQEQFERLAGARATTSRSVDDDFRLRAQPFTTRDGARGVVVVSEPLEPYEADERAALVVSLVAASVIVALSTAAAAWATRRVLAPVSEMARTADQWSERDLDRRFDLGPPRDELLALGATLDGLLEKVSGAIRAEQRLTSELAHELRTPLTAVTATAGVLALRDDLDDDLRDDLAEIQSSCRAMAVTITGLLDLARVTDGSRARGCCDVAEVVRDALSGKDPDGRAALALGGAEPDPRAAVPHDLAVRALSPLLDNALRLAEHVTVTVARDGAYVDVVVGDDGPGLPPDAETLFEPGRSTGTGTGLGLPLARRVARSLGGDVVADRPDGGRGARLVLRLPAAATT